ncbi:hypothetical protein C8F01DRAFT_1374838 [Mycena amicta]|nr:hypothetical protein C8F01DRAFT_1374838 [Mycena amicta]
MAEVIHGMQSKIGAALAGCLASVGLSAVLGFQTFLYFQIFPMDSLKYKLLVAWVWLNDAAHTILICTTIWSYIVEHFGSEDFIKSIVPTLAVTVAITAITTLSVNIFYAWRIHKMSGGNRFLTGLISLLCLTRTGLAFVTTAEMILTKTFDNFNKQFSVILVSGLSISAATDIVVSIARYYYLRNLRQGYPGTQEMVDAVVVFTINDGCLTCAVVLGCIACLLRMPNNFIWLSIYFTIAKLYSNSILATLKLRNWYRHRKRPMGIPLTQRPQLQATAMRNTVVANHSHGKMLPSNDLSANMEVFVDQQVEYNVAVEINDDSRSSRKSMDVVAR